MSELEAAILKIHQILGPLRCEEFRTPEKIIAVAAAVGEADAVALQALADAGLMRRISISDVGPAKLNG
jgi:hypothetical protein